MFSLYFSPRMEETEESSHSSVAQEHSFSSPEGEPKTKSRSGFVFAKWKCVGRLMN